MADFDHFDLIHTYQNQKHYKNLIKSSLKK